MTTAWVEAQANWTLAQTGTLWESPGASGSTERGSVAASTTHVPKQSVVFDSDIDAALVTQLKLWLSPTRRVALQVAPANGGVFIAATRESGTKGLPLTVSSPAGPAASVVRADP